MKPSLPVTVTCLLLAGVAGAKRSRPWWRGKTGRALSGWSWVGTRCTPSFVLCLEGNQEENQSRSYAQPKKRNTQCLLCLALLWLACLLACTAFDAKAGCFALLAFHFAWMPKCRSISMQLEPCQVLVVGHCSTCPTRPIAPWNGQGCDSICRR